MREIVSGSPTAHQQQGVALIGHLDHLKRRAARAHRLNRGGRQDVGIGAADYHHRHVGERVELRPQRRERLFEVDSFQRLGELGVVGRHQRAIHLAKTAARAGEPVSRPELGKLRVEQAAQDFGAFLERPRLRQFADIALDAHQTLRLDYRTDIVEHDAGDHRRPHGCEQHGEDAATRGADKNRRRGIERGDDRKHVGQLDLEVIAGRIAVVFGLAAAAVIERDDTARPGGIARQRIGQRVEIGGGAGEAGQADHWQRGRAAASAAHRMQPQAVGGGDEVAYGDCAIQCHSREAFCRELWPVLEAAGFAGPVQMLCNLASSAVNQKPSVNRADCS